MSIFSPNATAGPDDRTPEFESQSESGPIHPRRELSEYSDYLHLAEKLARVGHWHVNLETKTCYWSPEAYAIHGCDPDTFTPTFDNSLASYHEDDRQDVVEIISAAIRDKSDFTYRKRLVRRDTGEVRIVRATGVCEHDADGKVTGLFGVFHDKTDIVKTQEQLARSEERYRLLADQSNDIIMTFDVHGRFDYLSPAMTRVLGYDTAELLGHPVQSLIHPDDIAPVERLYDAYVSGKDWENGPRIRLRAIHKDGHFVWVEGSPRAILGEDGKTVVGFQDVVRDISEQKAIEIDRDKALKQVEVNAGQYRLLIDNIPGMVAYWDADLRCKFANPSYLDRFGLSEEAMIGISLRELLGEETFALYEPFALGVLAGQRQSFERTVTNALGEHRETWVQSIPDFDSDGAVRGTYVLIMDVTAQKDKERALEAANTELTRAQTEIEANADSYRLLTENIPHSVGYWDKDLRCRFANLNYKQFDKSGRENLSGVSIEDYLGDELFRRNEAFIRDALKGKPQSFERAFPGADGALQYVWVQYVPHIDASGSVLGFYVIVADVTPLKLKELTLEKVNAELVEAQKLAEAAADAKAEFLATMSHELRTPLTSIVGFSALLRDRLADDTELRRHSERIHTASQGLMSLINDILDHSKLDAGELKLDMYPCSVSTLAQGVVDLLSLQASAKGLDLRLVGADNIHGTLMLDEMRLRQILLNLVSNAVKFTSSGSVTVTIVLRKARSGHRLYISVSDTGTGISEEGKQHLFQRFSQVDKHAHRDKRGTGLGLLICKQLVDLMDGDIGANSLLGEGSEFWFEIPAGAVGAEQGNWENPQPASPSVGRLLVVDDNASNLELITLLLTSQGYDVQTAVNGADALNACLERPFDLILMDLNMPVMDGLVATRGIRASSDANSHTPILALTASGGGALAACIEAGMNDVVAKPIQNIDLLTAVASWLSIGA